MFLIQRKLKQALCQLKRLLRGEGEKLLALLPSSLVFQVFPPSTGPRLIRENLIHEIHGRGKKDLQTFFTDLSKNVEDIFLKKANFKM